MNYSLKAKIIQQLTSIKEDLAGEPTAKYTEADKDFINEVETALNAIYQGITRKTDLLPEEVSNTKKIIPKKSSEKEGLLINLLSDQVNDYAHLKFDTKLEFSEFEETPLGAVCSAVNSMGEEMQMAFEELKLKDRKLKELTKLLNSKNKQALHSIGEKETLLQELHHRVKNNLQIIIGLIKMQSRRVNSEETLKNLKSIENRISSIAQVQGLLLFHKTNQISKVEVVEYIDSMIILFSDVYESKHVINFTHNLEKKTHLSIDKSVSLGLIINEIVSNINEHAYQEEEVGTIEISLAEKGKLLCLMIDDRGKGIKPNTEKEKSMGLKIISLLCAKLGASAEMKNQEKGVRVSITFKNGI